MGGKVCRACAAELDADARFCLSCGAVVDAAPGCSGCGAALEADARFCPQCGATVGSPKASSTTAAPVAGPAAKTGWVVPALVLLIAGVAAFSFWRGGAPVAPPAAPPPAVGQPAQGAMGAMPIPGGMGGAPGGMGGGGGMAGGAPGGMGELPPGHGGEVMGGDAAAAAMRTKPDGTIVFPHGGMGGMPAAQPTGGEAAGPIAGTIEVVPELADKVKAGGVLYLMARPVGEGAQPAIAAAKITITKLPQPFELGAEDLMGGQWGAPVNLEIRLDSDEDARTKTPGDLIGNALGNPVKPGDTAVRVVLDRAL